jgi:hypothetical protein
MFKHLLVLAGLGTVLFSGPLALSLRADEWDQETDITVNEPISVDGTVLIPGEYVLTLMDSDSDRDAVEIYGQDQEHLITTVHAIPAYRPDQPANLWFRFTKHPLARDRNCGRTSTQVT